jgi:hypothetical protein
VWRRDWCVAARSVCGGAPGEESRRAGEESRGVAGGRVESE